MKRLLFSTLMAISCFQLKAQTIFMTEYVEGDKNQHAIEIVNNSGAPIDISSLRICTYYNGGLTHSSPSFATLADDGVTNKIPHQGVFVFYFTGQDGFQDADATFPNAKKSQRAGISKGGSLGFNGNDAIELQYNNGSGWKRVDLFGKIGDNPDMQAWKVSGTKLTASNRALYRISSVKTGVVENPEVFDLAKEWALVNNEIPAAPINSLGQAGPPMK
ncbi:hypothetical protein [Pedobacter puniceum]|jgi:hypothetical protein|uniref:Lamin tail domain-containing protein n=1 Tax=Pedobacter puniceum TaxID=2666136 RepID=A0A7K0FIG0_9SPHI|nr:hypothetical protein [Pedobacter puniceum]MRX45764.1 hypothetical protein [Pedobacter puniceum]